MAVISVALLNRNNKPANYIVADDSGLTGVGVTGRAIADQRMRLAESSPRRIGGIPADAEGWVVSVTPSGGWIPAFIAGRTGIGLSQIQIVR